MTTQTPMLDEIRTPSDLKGRSKADLRQIADELRAETINAVSTTGGHLGSALGVVELTVAMHAVFNTPKDKIVWDVGHQTYPHKILTGRRERIRTLRQGGGLSGFTKRDESVYDPFGAAHAVPESVTFDSVPSSPMGFPNVGSTTAASRSSAKYSAAATHGTAASCARPWSRSATERCPSWART